MKIFCCSFLLLALSAGSLFAQPPTQAAAAGAQTPADAAKQPASAAPAAAKATPAAADEDKASSADDKQAVEDLRKEFLTLLGGPDLTKASSIVTCTWSKAKPSSGNDDQKAPSKKKSPPPTKTLDCAPALLVSGDIISTVRVVDIPENKALTVSVVASDYWYPLQREPPKKTGNDRNDLSQDSQDWSDGRTAALIQIHKDRYIHPTYGGVWSSKTLARENLRGLGPDGKPRNTLSVVLSAAPVLLQVQVSATDENAKKEVRTAQVFIVYQRWSVETGGFLAVTNLGDQTLVKHSTTTSSGTAGGGATSTGTVHVDAIERSHGVGQETGIFLNLIPRNYEFFGVGLGLATASDRPQSIYLGVSLRARAFGDSALASLFLGAVNRHVRVFRGVVGLDFAADNSKLDGTLESRIGYAIGFNLGFKFGSIGGGDSASKPATTTTSQ